ncbi:pitrilysin family protein [Streptomyces sp. MST-110588]|uniref:M16 family metallopeptidase n=1 Tax=Streptomyces sp. MST-110588 TaxID=2833628 RepID=UPI001F5CAA73|nr:pitrilysin family protein [Streptomyces sp. MST-110588]UNO41782.1 insulinase family protein [Streptomyces sp. MST-110588]
MVRRIVLDNGLKVLLAPRRGTSLVAVCMHYDIGFRSEPPAFSGFAHLFEHLMFQGSGKYPKLAHWNYVQGLGGSINGTTHPDYTDYFQLLPKNGLAEVLAMEADRLDSLVVSDESLGNQRAVVKEEIRTNIMNRAYGGFPWIPLPALLYRTYPNAHNGYGEWSDLDAVTVADAVEFHRTYYVPSNAVLTVSGDFDVPGVLKLIHKLFGVLPSRPRPPAPTLQEPVPERTVRGTHTDVHAPLPALALGYRLPDPGSDLTAYLAHMALCEILACDFSGALHTRLVRDKALAVRVSAGCGLFNSLDARAPDTLAIVVTCRPGVEPEDTVAEIDEELARLAARDTIGALVPGARNRLAARLYRRNADLLAHTRTMGAYELLHGRAELVDELPERVAALDTTSVQRAVTRLLSPSRAVLRLVPRSAPPGRTAGTEVAVAS